MVYEAKDNYDDSLSYFENEEQVIELANEYAERMNNEKESSEKDIIVKNYGHAVEVLNSANIDITEVEESVYVRYQFNKDFLVSIPGSDLEDAERAWKMTDTSNIKTEDDVDQLISEIKTME